MVASDASQLKTVLVYYEGKPIGKPTMTQSDKWRDPPRPAVEKWWAFKNGLMAAALEQGFRPGVMEIRALGIAAFIEMPKSWSKKKKLAKNGELHLSKPDLSNIFKAVEDALTEKDETIAIYPGGTKHWAPAGGISIMLQVIRDDGNN